MKLAGAFLALIPLAFGGIDKVREIRLSDYIHESDPSEVGEAHVAVAAAFSPDGRFLAVTTYRGHGPHTHLVILDVGSQSSRPRQFDLDACPQDIQWSPSGAALKICDMILRVADGSTCHEDRTARFVDEERTGHFAQPNFVLDDFNCKMTASWRLDGDLIVDSAPARKLALFRSSGQLKILDLGTREVLQGWSHKPGALMHVAFAEAGGTICLSEGQAHSRLGCWELSSGAEILQASKLSGYLQAAAPSSSRIVMNTSVHIPLDITDGGCCDFSHRRKVYDVRSAREIASWSSRAELNDPWSVCVLSADGRLVAETAKGILLLYRLTP